MIDIDEDEPKVKCGFRDCHQCCLDTEMLLTTSDLERIEKAGFDRNEFCLDPKQTGGFWQLRNINGRCFFLDEKGRCSIYRIRPLGCRLYPLILALDTNEVIIDEDCREKEWFKEQEYTKDQVISVHSLVSTLLLENPDYSFSD